MDNQAQSALAMLALAGVLLLVIVISLIGRAWRTRRWRKLAIKDTLPRDRLQPPPLTPKQPALDRDDHRADHRDDDDPHLPPAPKLRVVGRR
jgi:hypothetical protein